jgi:hypothetical protein
MGKKRGGGEERWTERGKRMARASANEKTGGMAQKKKMRDRDRGRWTKPKEGSTG